MAKSPDAFRTISEVSEWLDTPGMLLRFWESKFTQIKQSSGRAGGGITDPRTWPSSVASRRCCTNRA